MSRNAMLIFNPVAGQGNPEEDLEIIKNTLSPEINLDIQMTSEDKGGGEIAQIAIKNGVENIIVSGGDGTISAVAHQLINQQIPLGIIPRGTANALANALNISDNLEEACKTILEGRQQVIDTARCNGKTMVLLAGIGFEAETIHKTESDRKKRWGILAYILPGIQELQQFNQFEVEIETEEHRITIAEAIAVTVANIAPPTSILAQGPGKLLANDGLLDITILTPNNRLRAVTASYHLLQTALREEVAQRDDIGYLRAQKVRITANPPQKVVLDGEMCGETPCEIECIPGSLIVYVSDSPNQQPQEKLEGISGLEVEEKQNN